MISENLGQDTVIKEKGQYRIRTMEFKNISIYQVLRIPYEYTVSGHTSWVHIMHFFHQIKCRIKAALAMDNGPV